MEETVQDEIRNVQEEDRHVPDGRKVEETVQEEAGIIPDGRKENLEENVQGVQEEPRNVPEDRKEGKKHPPVKPPLRRKRGKLKRRR